MALSASRSRLLVMPLFFLARQKVFRESLQNCLIIFVEFALRTAFRSHGVQSVQKKASCFDVALQRVFQKSMEHGLYYWHAQLTFALPNRDHAIQHLVEHCVFVFPAFRATLWVTAFPRLELMSAGGGLPKPTSSSRTSSSSRSRLIFRLGLAADLAKPFSACLSPLIGILA